VARGLCALHQAGIVHRDLKPSNVLVELRAEGGSVARVADFGVARPLDRVALGSAVGPMSRRRLGDADTVSPPAAPLTVDGELVGTPRYMPPEAATATGSATPAADVFALGLVICEVLTGRYPFANVPLFSALSGEPPRLLEIDALPVPLSALVPRMLDGLPERRPAASEVLQALQAAGDRPA
jgi:serine/threonine-protein kinase